MCESYAGVEKAWSRWGSEAHVFMHGGRGSVIPCAHAWSLQHRVCGDVARRWDRARGKLVRAQTAETNSDQTLFRSCSVATTRVRAQRWCEKLAWHSQSGSCLKVLVENAGMILPTATVHRQKRRWGWRFSYRARIYKFRHSDWGVPDDGGETFPGEICGGICYCSDWRD